MGNKAKTQEIQDFILEKVARYPNVISQMVQEKYGLTKQGAYYHLSNLVNKGLLVSDGKRKAKTYEEALQNVWMKSFDLAGLQEDSVWSQVIESGKLPILNPDKAEYTLMYGFTEILNNAIEHSEGQSVYVRVEVFHSKIKVIISDNGIGIFKKIQMAENLDHERDAILLLAKGKYTSMPENHSGQGIFFTSKAFSFFDIISRGVYFMHERESCSDCLLENIEDSNGTTVVMELSINSSLNMEKLFSKYTSKDGNFSFDTTIVPVKKLKTSNEGLVSRSQAKRLMVSLHKFEQVYLDFDGVNRVGQAFADEIFRVWSKRHPSISIVVRNANNHVNNMISRAKKNR